MQSELYQSIFSDGEKLGIRQAIADLCEVLAIEVTAERKAILEHMDLDPLSVLRLHLKGARAWPAGT